MKNVTYEITTKDKDTGEKKNLGTIEVPKFEAYTEIVAFYETQSPGKGEETFLKEFNQLFKNSTISAERVKLLRGPNPFKELKKAAALDADVKAELEALMKKLGIAGKI